MVNIPKNEISDADFIEWDRLKVELGIIKTKEMLLRKKIFKAFFAEATEGTYYQPMANGWRLKAVAKLDRSVDTAVLPVMRPQFEAAGINADTLIEYKPSLLVAAYRKLTDEQRTIFDCALTIKPGSPALELVAPKAEK